MAHPLVIGTWIIREEKNLIIDYDSPLTICYIVWVDEK
jgi:hypothetical protein